MPDRVAASFLTPLVSALASQRTSVAVWGAHRHWLTRVGVGLAYRLDPQFIWFDIRDPGVALPAWQTYLEARVGPDRLRSIEIGEMRLNDEAGNDEGTRLLRDPVQAHNVVPLSDLMRIPERLRAAAIGGSATNSHVLLLTNAERAGAAFSGSLGALRPYIEALNRSGCTIVLTACGQARENRRDLDLVLHLEDGDGATMGEAAVVCESVRTHGTFPSVPPASRYELAAFNLPPVLA